MNTNHDTIVAPATAAGGAIAVIRISGGEAFAVCDRIFRGRRPLAEADGYTVHYGTVADGDRVIDDVLATVFRAPHSYTGEDSVEISCHGSSYIVPEILRLLTAAGGPTVGETVGETVVRVLAALGRFFLASVWNAAFVFLVVAAVSFSLSWLLVRRAVIRGAK